MISKPFVVALSTLLAIFTANAPILSQEIQKDMRIRLLGATFDPVRGAPTGVASQREREPATGKGRWIVQFQDSLTREQRELLRSQYGLRLDQYVRNYGFLETIDADRLADLRKLGFYRADVFYQPAFKISQTIGQVEYRTEYRRDIPGLLLSAILFNDADLVAVAGQLRALPGVADVRTYDDRALGGVARILFQLADAGSIPDVARLDGVRLITEVGEIIDDNVATSGLLQSGNAANTPVWNQNLHGEGQLIGIIDSSPVDINHCFFQDPTDNTIRFDHRKIVAQRNAGGDTPTGHATFTAGNVAGDDFNNPGTHARRGTAWAARLVAGVNDDLDIMGGPTTMLAELNAAKASGAFIHTNSWHEDTAGAGNPATYSQVSADVDTFTWNNEDHLVLGSAGNNGEEQGPPGTAKNGICVAATQTNLTNLGDGNPGPTSDQRRKPDLVTPGCSIQSATVNTACNTGPWSVLFPCATSFATPHTAGAAALARQYYMEGWYPTGTAQPHHSFVPSGALLKATLLNSTVDMTGVAGYPNQTEGWGVIRLDNALFFAGDTRNSRVWDVRNASGLATGESHEYNLVVAGSGQQLKITLVWTEPPSTDGDTTPVVNDLDLEVVNPDGTQTFFGNGANFAGGVSTVGGARDTLNNVEQVVLNNPALGTWTIRVAGTAINVGSPGQGYAIVASGDFPEPPPPTGDQDTLVVRVGISDVLGGAQPSLTVVQNLMADLINYIDEVSYGEATIAPVYPDPIALDQTRSYYFHPSRNPLVEMTEEAIDKRVIADADVFNRGTPDPTDDIDRMILVLNDSGFTADWATTGEWPYSFPDGLTRPISVSIQSVYNDPGTRFAHGMGHQLGLVDLHAYPNVIFAQPHVDEWDNMAEPFTGSGVMAWSKELAGWLTAHGTPPQFIPRPAAGTTNTIVGIDFLSNDNTDPKAIAIGLTEGAATMASEDVFYWVEARSNAPGTLDQTLPETGVLVYFVDENVRQGEGPVRILDDNLATTPLNDAALEVGDSQSPAGRGLTVTVQSGTAAADRNIQISYDPPETDNDVRITVGDPHWTSPDIWVDSQKNGFDEDEGRVPMDRGDQPVTGEVNRIYVRIRNAGPGTAFDFTIFVRVSEPYHTVGGSADFNRFVGQIHVPSLANSTDLVRYVEWTPDEDGDPHSCVEVQIPNVFNDVNSNNNRAQQNLQEVASSTSSPFSIVAYRFGLTNEEDQQQLFYFRAEGVPADWTANLNPGKALLLPDQRIDAILTLQPPDDAPVCTDHKILVTSWMPRGDTLVPVGGGTVQVDLRNRTQVTLQASQRPCNIVGDQIRSTRTSERGFAVQVPSNQPSLCREMVVQGCTQPPRPNEEIIVRYEHPDGYPIYRTVTTDGAGCYSDFLVIAEGGAWQVLGSRLI